MLALPTCELLAVLKLAYATIRNMRMMPRMANLSRPVTDGDDTANGLHAPVERGRILAV